MEAGGALRVWGVALGVLCLGGVGACGDAAGGGGEVSLRFWAMGREGEVVAELVREFEREHPGIRVEVQQIPWTAAHEKLLTAYVGGAGPDVAQLGNTWVAEFAAVGALEALDGRVAASRVVRPGSYFGGIWRTNVVDDTVWGVPWYVDTRVVFYRKDILSAAGYDSVPGTWAGWRAALRAVKRELDGRGYPLLLPANEWAQPVIFGLQNGAGLLDEEGRRGAFRERRFREAFDFYLGLYREGLAPALGDHELGNAYQEFGRGRFAMWITGPWNLGEFGRRLPPELQDRWGTAPLPGPSGGESGVSLAGGSSLVVLRGSRHKAAAWALIEFLSRPEQQVRFFELSGNLPARIEAWGQAGLAEGERTRAFWVQLGRVRPLPAVPEIESIVSRVGEHAEAAIRGGVPAERSLEALDAAVDRILEKRRWLLDRRAWRAGGGEGT